MSLEYLDDEWKWAFDTLVYIKFLATISFNIFTVWWHMKKKTISTLKALLKTVSYNLFLGTQKVFKVSQNEKVRLLRLMSIYWKTTLATLCNVFMLHSQNLLLITLLNGKKSSIHSWKFQSFKRVALNIQVWVTLASNSSNIQMPHLPAFMMLGSLESTVVHV